MEVSRRLFLGALGGSMAAAAVGLPALSQALPVLYGDGIGDDTAAVKTLLDGKPFINRSVWKKVGPGYIGEGTYRIKGPLEPTSNSMIEGARFVIETDGCMVRYNSGTKNSTMRRCYLEAAPMCSPDTGIEFYAPLSAENLAFRPGAVDVSSIRMQLDG